MQQKKPIALILGISVLAFSFLAFMTPTGSPGGKTGSPGDGNQTCTSCHSGNATAVTGWITTNIPPTGYVAGTTYSITLTGTHTGVVLFGFEATAEDASNAKKGTFVITNSTETKLTNGNKAVTHKSAGTMPSGNSKVWSFDWTAPAAGSGQITFYAALLAANGNGNNSGDVVYRTSLAVDEEVAANNPPVFTSEPIDSAQVGVLYSYAIQCSDPDGGAVLTITAPTLPSWLSLTPGTNGNATLSGTPTIDQVGDFPVVLEVSDGNAPAVQQAFTIEVKSGPNGMEWSPSGISIVTYPNPGRGFLEVRGSETFNLRVLDSKGQTVFQADSSSPSQRFDSSNWPKGLLFLELTSGGKKEIRRWMNL